MCVAVYTHIIFPLHIEWIILFYCLFIIRTENELEKSEIIKFSRVFGAALFIHCVHENEALKSGALSQW